MSSNESRAASLPIVEYLFQWRGIGQLELEAVGRSRRGGFIPQRDRARHLFAALSAVADISRHRVLYRAT